MSRVAQLAKRLAGKTDEAIADELVRLQGELRVYRKKHSLFRERAIAGVDAEIAEARATAWALVAGLADAQGPTAVMPFRGFDPPATQAAKLLAVTNPEYREARLAAIDADVCYANAIPIEEYEAEVARRRDEIRDLEMELQRRQIDGERQEAERELKALEGRV